MQRVPISQRFSDFGVSILVLVTTDQVLNMVFLGVQKSLSHAQTGRFLIQIFPRISPPSF